MGGQVHDSCAKLGVNSLYGLLLHNSSDLHGCYGSALNEALCDLKLSGLVSKIGISIYDPSELDQIIQLIDIDLIQAPLNLIDRRIETSGWLYRLKKKVWRYTLAQYFFRDYY